MTSDQPVNARTLAAHQRKQDAYANRRRSWTQRMLGRAEDPAPEPTGDAPSEPARPARGGRSVIHDKRQVRLDL